MCSHDWNLQTCVTQLQICQPYLWSHYVLLMFMVWFNESPWTPLACNILRFVGGWHFMVPRRQLRWELDQHMARPAANFPDLGSSLAGPKQLRRTRLDSAPRKRTQNNTGGLRLSQFFTFLLMKWYHIFPKNHHQKSPCFFSQQNSHNFFNITRWPHPPLISNRGLLSPSNAAMSSCALAKRWRNAVDVLSHLGGKLWIHTTVGGVLSHVLSRSFYLNKMLFYDLL